MSESSLPSAPGAVPFHNRIVLVAVECVRSVPAWANSSADAKKRVKVLRAFMVLQHSA